MSRRNKKPTDLDDLAKQRHTLVLNQLARRVSIGEDLLTVLNEPKLGRTIENLLTELAAITTMSSPNRSTDTEVERHAKNSEPPIPQFTPSWAAKRLAKTDRILWQEAESLAAWVNKPYDPTMTRAGRCWARSHDHPRGIKRTDCEEGK